jgi:geranylgeranyl diphosphate synthase, type I
MLDFYPSLAELRTAVDVELHRFLDERFKAVPDAAELIDEIARVVSAGGKRLRPAFCYWGFRAAGGRHGPEIVRAAASLELLHTFAIVHDDIMDDSDERRGEPTVHVRHGLGFALLTGDLALVLADALFFSAGFAPAVSLRAFGAYSLMRQEVIAGQHLDVMHATRTEISEQEARHIAVLKSGRYSIEKPLVIGALLADAPEGLVAGLSAFGDPLGEAFQLRDDLLGSFGDRSSLGKPVDSDIREGKRNVLFAATTRLLTGPDRQFFVERWGGGDSLSSDDVQHLRDLVDRSGARAVAEEMLRARAEEAARAIGGMDVDEHARTALRALAHEATDRDI